MTRRSLLLAAPGLALRSADPEISLIVAGISVTPERWNKEANYARLDRYARQAAALGAQLIIAPEGFLEGYVANDKQNPDITRERYFAVGEKIDGPLMRRVGDLARELKVHLSIGFAESRDGRMYNSSALFSPEGTVALRYSKSHTARDEPFNAKGVEFPVAQTALGRIGTLICYDRQLPETARILAIKGAQLILVPAWGAYGEMNDVMMRTRAYENGVWVAFVHPKRVLIIDPRGKIVAQNTGAGDQVVTAKITIDTRVGSGPIRDRTPAIYGDLLK